MRTVNQHLQSVLEPTGLDVAVHPALLGRVLLPPPATRARVLAGSGAPGAWRASDAGVALVVQRVAWHLVGSEVVPNLFVSPIRQRVELRDSTVLVVQLDLSD